MKPTLNLKTIDLPFPEAALLFYAVWMLRAQILMDCSTESCIYSTRAACLLFGHLGFRPIPLACSVEALNPAAAAAFKATGQIEVTPESEQYGVAVRLIPGEDGTANDNDKGVFHGHVALVAERYLIDPSVDQVNRPTRDIAVPPLVAGMTPEQLSEFLDGDSVFEVDSPDGSLLRYRSHIEDSSYQTAPDWSTADADLDKAVDSTLALCEAAIDAGRFSPLPPLPQTVSANAMDVLREGRANGLSWPEMTAELHRRGYDPLDVAEGMGTAMGRLNRRRHRV